MRDLSFLSQVILYALLGIMSLYSIAVFVWQIKVLNGESMKNPDGTFDSWRQQKVFYGIAFADVLLSCPLNILAVILVFVEPRWGFYLLALVSYWWVWANLMTTVNSLRFEKPAITFNWFIVFPAGIFIGLAYIIWSIINFEIIYQV